MGCALAKGHSRRREVRPKSKHGGRRGADPEVLILQKDAKERHKNKEEERISGDSVGRVSLAAEVTEARLRSGALSPEEEWPSWLVDVAGEVIKDLKPRRINTFEKLDKVGQGTYSNVYKARDLMTGKVVAMKKVRFDKLEPETVSFMAREILALGRLNHPNVIKLEGVVISRFSSSLYLVLEYMEHDLAGLAEAQGVKFSEPQIKCYMKQLLSGLEHCHNNGVLHRDIKCSNLLIDNEGNMKIGDFGLALFYDPEHKKPMTSRVVTLWYRPPELLLGATHYGVGVDLWSAGCILGELFTGKPILQGQTEIEQLHLIFKLCGSPTEEYFKKNSIQPNPSFYKFWQAYEPHIMEAFKDFPPCSLSLLKTLLAIDPDARGTATAALNCEFFMTKPYACEPSMTIKLTPTKELNMLSKDEEARRRRGLAGKHHKMDLNRRVKKVDKVIRAIPTPEANAKIQTNFDRLMMISNSRVNIKSEKFPPPHEDGAVGNLLAPSQNGRVSFSATDASLTNSNVNQNSSSSAIHGKSKTTSFRRAKQ